MSTVPSPATPLPGATVVGVPVVTESGDRWMTELHGLLRELEAVTAANRTLPPVFSEKIDDQLVQIRLGLASSLFAALQCKNAAVAGHSLRVALTCSAWTLKMNLHDSDRDAVEVAALLHDIGVIGAPDRILLKPGQLDPDESAVMHRTRKMSLDILRRSCTSPQILEIVQHVPAWFNGSKRDMPLSGREIPFGARMIAVAEAFDAMTTDHVFRRALSQERAIAELYDCAGAQFDPDLVQRFDEFRQGDQTAVRWEVAHRWLRSLEPELVNSYWNLSPAPAIKTDRTVDALFQDRLLESMYDAVVFVDFAGRVVLWNRGTERLTGVAGVSVCGEMWRPELLGLSDEKGQVISQADCPVQTAMRCGVQSLRRLTILGRGQQPVSVDTQVIPVINEHGISQGTILLLHDASSETSLEQRCQSLHEKATKDPLTQVSNRAEFDRVHAMFVAAHQQQQVPCSLLMCDLDRFKQVNDTFGHQAGDDVIKCLASLLKSSCRPGDLVARYGGEEFVLLCADCDNAAAARRADQIRRLLSQVPQPKMDNRSATVSFGVTEIQPGDTPETMLRRADRALLMAKSSGRNRVVQLGVGGLDETPKAPSAARLSNFIHSKELIQQELITPVPLKMAVEKLRGFVADHQARILATDKNRVQLEIEERAAGRLRRMTDRATIFCIDVSFQEEHLRRTRAGDEVSQDIATTHTRIKVSISTRKNRERRRDDIMPRAKEVLTSFRSYLMAAEEEPAAPGGPLSRAKWILTPWRSK